jgi:hypothetical protein
MLSWVLVPVLVPVLLLVAAMPELAVAVTTATATAARVPVKLLEAALVVVVRAVAGVMALSPGGTIFRQGRFAQGRPRLSGSLASGERHWLMAFDIAGRPPPRQQTGRQAQTEQGYRCACKRIALSSAPCTSTTLARL